MYVVVIDQGYEGYSLREDCENIDDVLAIYASYGNSVYAVYKVEDELTVENLRLLKQKREQSRLDAIAVAKAKLTIDECKLLGIA